MDSSELLTYDYLTNNCNSTDWVFENLHDPKGTKEISLDWFGLGLFIKVYNGKDNNLFLNKNCYALKFFSNGLCYLQHKDKPNQAYILDKKGNVVFTFDNSNLFERFDYLIPIKLLWETRYSRAKAGDFYIKYKKNQGYEFY